MKNILWSLFGNEDDGPYGIYPATWLGAVRWWMRNPFHNLFHHVINCPNGPFFKFGKRPGFNGYVGFRPPNGNFGAAFRYERH